MTETEIQRDILDAMRAVYPHGQWFRVQAGRVKVKRGYMQLAPKGTPDLHGDVPVRESRRRLNQDGLFSTSSAPLRMLPVAIEVKVPGKDATAEQAEKLSHYEANNAVGIVAHSTEEALLLMRAELGRLGLEAV